VQEPATDDPLPSPGESLPLAAPSPPVLPEGTAIPGDGPIVAREIGPTEPEGRDAVPEPARPVSPKRILVNVSDPEETRIAVVEDGKVEEIYFERAAEKKYLGNIYKGRVTNLEPAIQAAFVDLGIGRNGFLHASDVLPSYAGATSIPLDRLSERPNGKRLKIQELLANGQDVLVQITKDSIGAKGPTITTYVSLPGQYLVLMPGIARYGVSKRIEDRQQRAKLRESLFRLAPPSGMGYIVRTAGQDRDPGDIERDMAHITAVWNDVRDKVRLTAAPALLYQETDMVIRVLRDLLAADIDEILIDDRDVWERAREFLSGAVPELAGRVQLYEAALPLFTKYGIEEEIEKIYNRKIPLPSGGYLVIEQTEALVAIDVNSGRYRDEEDLEATALKINLEAAQEIARQLRLRDLGGVIVNDFIDMEVEKNRKELERAMVAALRRDRAKCWVSKISRFGIIEMTRQRVRPSFERANYEPCQHCRGTGVVKTVRSVGIKLLRQLRAHLAQKKRSAIEVVVHPNVLQYLVNQHRRQIAQLEDESSRTISLKSNTEFEPDQVLIRSR